MFRVLQREPGNLVAIVHHLWCSWNRRGRGDCLAVEE